MAKDPISPTRLSQQMDLQRAEAELAQASETKHSAVVSLVRQLNEAVVYPHADNEATNRKLCVC